MSCATADDLRLLVDYWTGELPEEEALRLEEHLFACAACAARLGGVEQLATGLRHLARSGRFRSVVPPSLVDRLAADGARIRTYRLVSGAVTPCGVAADDELLAARLGADLRGVQRLDLVMWQGGGAEELVPDVPFDAAAGEVILAERVDRARAYPTHRLHLRLVGHGAGGERVVGEYALDHDAAGPPPERRS